LKAIQVWYPLAHPFTTSCCVHFSKKAETSARKKAATVIIQTTKEFQRLWATPPTNILHDWGKVGEKKGGGLKSGIKIATQTQIA
jgi:hypothetical protein